MNTKGGRQQVLIDVGEKVIKEGRQVRPRRHIYKADGTGLACGHLPSVGGLVQIPLFLRDFISVSDCKTCKEFAQSILDGTGNKSMWTKSKVETAFTPASNTGVNS